MLFAACKQKSNTAEASQKMPAQELEKPGYFPVTNYFLGQLTEFKNNGINPLKLAKQKDRTDSVWVKVEAFEKEFADYLSPQIDSASLAPYFTEKKFLDQTLNAITLSYDPVKQVPAAFPLQKLDIYIEPEKNTVQKIYMVKTLPGNKQQQLTWQAGKQCRSIVVYESADGKPVIENETIIKWDFDAP